MKKLAVALTALVAAGVLGACGTGGDSGGTTSTPPATTSQSSSQGTPSATLSSTPWETTSARDASGAPVPLTDAEVSNYVGFAYFKPNGTFTMYTLDDAPKMHGDWSVTPDGTTRTIVARTDDGAEQFRRDSDIVALNSKEFTYRVYPNQDDETVFFDIVHTPTNHQEPAN